MILDMLSTCSVDIEDVAVADTSGGADVYMWQARMREED